MNRVRICETITAATMAELRVRRDAVEGADLIELRLDGVADPDIDAALAGRRTPVVVTCRPRWDGGRFEGAEEDRLRLLARAIEAGAEFVDVEATADWRRLPARDGTGLVLSFHDWQGVPRDLQDRVRAMRAARPAVLKVAITAIRLTDCLALHGLADDPAQPAVLIAMGRRGQLTRVCPWRFGSCWTYAGRTAPGQVPTATLVERYRVRESSAATALYGIAGNPLGHSASVAMHNAAFADRGIDARYVAFESESMTDIATVAAALDARGLSVTAPHKADALRLAGEADDITRDLGAANTLRRTPDGWEARNDDVAGFLDPLDRRGVTLADRDVLVLGAGGAARAAIAALRHRGARVAVSARRADAAAEVAARFKATPVAWPPAGRFDLVVNTTPVGTWPHTDATPVAAGSVETSLVYDLVYNPLDTAFMRRARGRGAEAIGGLEMLVHQAARQFAWWTGQSAPIDVMRHAAEHFVTVEVSEHHEADDVR
jgi:3-dehydroquinate dehydratase/shikimate dehydrogenase